MKQAFERRNIVLFVSTASLVLLLAFGVYAANRLLNHWLLLSNVNHSVKQIIPAVEGSGRLNELETLILHSEATPKNGLLDGMRLSKDPMPLRSVPHTPPSMELMAAITFALAPSRIIAVHVADAQSLSAPIEAADLSQFAQEHDISADILFKTVASLGNSASPHTNLFVDWRGLQDHRSFVIVPGIQNGEIGGGLIILADHQPQIANLALITQIGSLIIAALCLASFLLAALLLWLRFSEQVKANRDIEYLAHHDPLTGLPNRAVFSAKLNEALRLVQAKASNMGVMLIDVDKFKEVNDTYGHGTGDIFLQVIADRLRSVFSDHLVARLSGDEFAVMIKSISDIGRLTKLASDMIAATGAPCTIDGKELRISLSIGIARASDGSWRSSRLLHCADLALYKAKHAGRSTFTWYTPDMDVDAQKRKEIENGLIKALRLDQFEVLYQPQYSLIDNKLKGYEALIRWEHPSKGTISPDIFIPVAEECGLIEAIGDWVLFHACREAASWDDKSLRVAVNVSAAQFKPGRTEQKVAEALRESNLGPERLEIEITESLLIANTDAVIDTLNEIRAIGVSIAMDDFGTGYSSLSYLSRFPFDKIKIDRSFIKNLGKEASTDAVVTSIIGLGRSLDVTITAEGVENQEQVTLLRAAGCNLAQGYLFGKPDTIRAHIESRARQTETRPANAVETSRASSSSAPTGNDGQEADRTAAPVQAMPCEPAAKAQS